MDVHHSQAMTDNTETYATDFYAWCLSTADLVRAGQWEAIDPEVLAEELESLGKSQKRELENRLDMLVMHLLKWAYQAPKRETGHSWYSTIHEQRRQIARLLRDNPSLQTPLSTLLPTIYQDARKEAIQEMGIVGPLEVRASAQAVFRQDPSQLDLPDLLRWSTLPSTCPWTIEQVLNTDFWPDAPVG